MPVLGHAFVGLATAEVTRPAAGSSGRPVLWAPVLVGLAYLPDVAAQILAAMGSVAEAGVSHSLVLALAAAVVLSVPIHVLWGGPWLWCFCVAGASIILHDVADLLAGGHDLPLWWPLSDRRVGLGEPFLSMPLELLLFGGAYTVFLGVGWCCRRRRRASGGIGAQSRRNWLGGAIIGVILLCAAGTQHLRDVREDQFLSARKLIADKQYAAALAALDEAERWPSTTHASRIDYFRAEAYAALGDRARAEECYLRSYGADPSYFWVVADLAVFYASSDEPAEVRRCRVAPYRHRMTTEFARVQALPRYLARLDEKLSEPTTRPAAVNR